MTIKQILNQNTVFRDAAVIAGKSGLNHEVSSVMVLEAPDIEDWGRSGQLLLTSFFALQSLDVENSRQFLVKCRDLGISGLVLKMGRLISDIPEFFADYCDLYEIPLISLPQDVRYETVIISILEPIIHQISKTQALFQKYNDLANDLLNGRLQDRESIDQALHYLKIESAPFYQVIMMQFPSLRESLFEETPLTARIFLNIREQLNLTGLRYAYLQIHDRMTLICNMPGGGHAAVSQKRLAATLEQIRITFHLPELSYQIALSDVHDRYHISELNHQVLDTQMINNLLGGNNYITDYNSLGIYKLFLNRNNLSLLDGLLTGSHVRLRKEAPELWETLVTYISTNQSLSESASQLFVHAKTVKYRINKIQKQYSLDLTDPEEIFRILLDARLFKLKDHFQPETSHEQERYYES